MTHIVANFLDVLKYSFIPNFIYLGVPHGNDQFLYESVKNKCDQMHRKMEYIELITDRQVQAILVLRFMNYNKFIYMLKLVQRSPVWMSLLVAVYDRLIHILFVHLNYKQGSVFHVLEKKENSLSLNKNMDKNGNKNKNTNASSNNQNQTKSKSKSKNKSKSKVAQSKFESIVDVIEQKEFEFEDDPNYGNENGNDAQFDEHFSSVYYFNLRKPTKSSKQSFNSSDCLTDEGRFFVMFVCLELCVYIVLQIEKMFLLLFYYICLYV
jgi:hypothetical protein